MGHSTRALPGTCNFSHHLPTVPLSCMEPQQQGSSRTHHAPATAPCSFLGMGQTPCMWGCSHLAPLSKCTFTGQCQCPDMCVEPLQTLSSPAAQALLSWRNVTFNAARSFFELEQNWSANQAGSSFYKVHKVCFHQPYHTDELLFTSNNDWEAKFHAGQVKNPFSSVTGSSKPNR